MSFFNSLMLNFDDDTFFGPHINPMNQMNSMFNSMLTDPFGMLGGFTSGSVRRLQQGRELMPFSGFPAMNDIFGSFQINTNDPNCHSFSSSTVMTMSSGPDGRPQVYQASQSTRRAPGGICETKKSVCDSVTGTKKVAIGHHIGERSHVLEREQNLLSGEMEERQEFINLDEDEADEFNLEWESKTRRGASAYMNGQSRGRIREQNEDIPVILDRYTPRSRLTSRRNYPAITSVPSSHYLAEKKHKGKKRSQKSNSLEKEKVFFGKKKAPTKKVYNRGGRENKKTFKEIDL